MTGGVSMSFQEISTCVFTGKWPWIEAATPYRVELTLRGPLATLSVESIGEVDGKVEYAGEYRVLWVGNRGNRDWPTCTGSIDSVTVEPLK